MLKETSNKQLIHDFTLRVTTLLYIFASISLILASFIMVGKSFYEIYDSVFVKGRVTKDIVDVISFTVIAIAVCDVGRYLIEEEVEHEKKLHTPAEARSTLTRFMVVVAIALSLEGLVGVFEMVNKDMNRVVFPLAIIICAVLVLIGLGFYQRLSATTEQKLLETEKNTIEKNEI